MRRAALALLGIILAGFGFAALGQRGDRLIRNPARGTRGVIAGGTDFAAEAGMRMFQRGGNAVDAGVAAMYAAAVTEYSHFGFGGEAPILIRAKTGKVWAIAGVGTMPKLATAEFFRQRKLQAGEVMQQEPGGLKGMVPVAGLMPALVPGMVDAGLLALREFGTKPFAEIIQPAIELADGTPLDEMRAGSIARSRRFFDLWPVSREHFLPNGQAPRPGEIFRQPNLARTLRAMAEAEKKALARSPSRAAAIDAVRDYFYRGEIARKIDAFSKANDGLLRYEDMAAFRLQLEEPYAAKYRGYTVYKPGFWSQGPAMLQALTILDGYEDRPAMNSAEYIHRLTEALKLAYADRDTYYGDPNFTKVPADVLLSREYAAERRKLITNRASLDFVPGVIAGQRGKHPAETEPVARVRIDDALMARDTTCVDAADKDGLVFSATPSGAWLPSVIAGDTGIPLTQRAQSFLLIPGHPNELAGGKRPRVTLSPTIVTHPDGRPYLALSTPGGDNQDQSLIQLILNVIDYGLNAQAAVEAPRLQTRHLVSSFDNHAWNRGDLLLDERIPQGVYQELAARGHRMGSRSRYNSGAAPVLIRYAPEGIIEGGADPFYYRVAWAW
jgi:gamma-glutamyltranspeptidase/glutathione hydrolase